MAATILIVDDHRLLREGLRALLQREGFQVIAEADNGRSAVQLAKKLQPDIVITDIGMPDLNGVEATKKICGEAFRTGGA
jgi:YesN/AraC family two-component response regulator